MRNEVFNNYVKIALEKGLITSEAQETQTSNKDYADTIKTLYNLDIPLNDSKKDIIEQAHPDPVVIAPSYDKLNGLVENVRERQNVMVGIARKPTNANLTMHRYAEAYQDLVNTLVSLGFKMSNRKQKALRILADACSYRLTQKPPFIKK